MDAPISFGPYGMDIMAGGPEEWFAEAEPIFAAVGHKATLVGPHGHGHITKLVQNMISGVNTAIVAGTRARGRRRQGRRRPRARVGGDPHHRGSVAGGRGCVAAHGPAGVRHRWTARTAP